MHSRNEPKMSIVHLPSWHNLGLLENFFLRPPEGRELLSDHIIYIDQRF